MTKTLQESELLRPVLGLFPSDQYWHFEEVPLGRKKIDVVCVERASPNLSISIELKIADWRKALWQAIVNFQLAEQSYIAIWHQYVHRAQRETELLNQYGIGLISVSTDVAELLIRSSDPVRRLSRIEKRHWYRHLLDREESVST